MQFTKLLLTRTYGVLRSPIEPRTARLWLWLEWPSHLIVWGWPASPSKPRRNRELAGANRNQPQSRTNVTESYGIVRSTPAVGVAPPFHSPAARIC